MTDVVESPPAAAEAPAELPVDPANETHTTNVDDSSASSECEEETKTEEEVRREMH